MRVLLVTHRFLPRYLAGTEVYVGNLARELARRGHTLRVFTGDPAATAPYSETWEGLPVEAVPWGLGGRGPVATFLAGFFNPPIEARFRRLLGEFQPEVVHIHHLLGLSPSLPRLARAAGARVVVSLHDYWFACANTWLMRWTRELCPGPGAGYYCGGCALHRLGRRPQPVLMGLSAPLFVLRTRRLQGALRAADRLIAPSQTLANAYQRQGVLAERIRVIAHGAPAAIVGRASGDDRQTSRPVRLVMIGSLIPPKGAHLAIEAFNGLPPDDSELTLYGDTAADPVYVAELRQRARRPGIRFAGQLPRERLAEVLRAADILLLPSLWEEPYGLVVDEALAAGVPVLAANLGAPAERVRSGVNGLLLPPGDVAAWKQALLRFAAAPAELAALRDRLRATGIGSKQPKTLDEHVSEIEQLYGERM